jgi:Zn-dependent protease with chaperone function
MVPATYFDGRSTRVHRVQLSVAGDALVVTGHDVDRVVPLGEVRIDERLGSAPRRLRLADGSHLEVTDLESLDQLLTLTPHRDGWVDQIQRRGRSVLLALLAFCLVLAAAYRWALPWGAAEGARRLSPVVAVLLSSQALKSLDGGLLQPSRIPDDRQRSLLKQFLDLRDAKPGTAQSSMLFRASPQLGANAFTLPDGTIVLLDDLVNKIGEDADIVAVLAHELGHAHERHGLQMLLRSSVVGAFLTFYLGDISQLLAAAPAALIQARYSQQFERQADDYGAELLRQHGLSPALLADALERLSKLKPEASGGGYLASHPPTEERISHLRALAKPEVAAGDWRQ